MNMKDCLGKLEELKEQLDLLEKQITERVRHEELNETAAIDQEKTEINRKLAQLELKDAREKIRQYHVS